MKEQIKMIVFVVILGIGAAGILVNTDTYTEAMIIDNQEYALKCTILSAFEMPYEENTVLEIYEDGIVEKDIDDNKFYYSEEGHVGFEFTGKGLWGPIDGFMTLEADHETIKGIQIIYNEETPGLGGVVAEQWYLDKYKGKGFAPELIIRKDADPSSVNEVDAITGATMTSKAFQLILNENYQMKKEVLE